jgi:hypothetical protein
MSNPEIAAITMPEINTENGLLGTETSNPSPFATIGTSTLYRTEVGAPK